MRSTDEPPPTKPKWSAEELQDRKVEFELLYEDKQEPLAGVGVFFVKRQFRDGSMLLYVEVQQINWHSTKATLDRLPLNQEHVDRIERRRDPALDDVPFLLLA